MWKRTNPICTRNQPTHIPTQPQLQTIQTTKKKTTIRILINPHTNRPNYFLRRFDIGSFRVGAALNRWIRVFVYLKRDFDHPPPTATPCQYPYGRIRALSLFWANMREDRCGALLYHGGPVWKKGARTSFLQFWLNSFRDSFTP